jgi:hypothetical protein
MRVALSHKIFLSDPGKAAAGRGRTGKGRLAGGREGKILSPAAKRRAVDMLKNTLSMSERLACKAVGLARSTYRRLPAAQTPVRASV